MNALRLSLIALLVLSAPGAAVAEGATSGADAGLRNPRLFEAPKSEAGTADAKPGDQAQGEKPKHELDVTGMLFDAESIRQVVNFHMPEIQECYEGVLSDSGKKIEGKLVVNFVIDTEGRVSQAKPSPRKSTLRDERVVDCVLSMRGWTFPKPGDHRDHPIEYPFVLSVKK